MTTTRPRRERSEAQVAGLNEKVVSIKRVTKVVKGGRHFSFNAMVVVGDGAGHVGIGLGKAGEVPEAVRKGTSIARRNLIEITMAGSTLPHKLVNKYGASLVMLKPASPGTGVIAGGSVRAVVTAAGIRDVLTKSLGSPNPINLVKATFEALSKMRSPEETVKKRKELAAALAASPPPEPRSPRPPRPSRPQQARDGQPPPPEGRPPRPPVASRPEPQPEKDLPETTDSPASTVSENIEEVQQGTASPEAAATTSEVVSEVAEPGPEAESVETSPPTEAPPEPEKEHEDNEESRE